MAVTPDTVAILNPDEYVAGTPDGKIPSAESSTWSEFLQKESPVKQTKIEYAYQRMNENPPISELTQRISGEAMSRQYQAILKVDQNKIDSDPQYLRYKNFRTLIEETYRQKNNGQEISAIEDNPEALNKFMTSLMKEGKNELWAIKVAEEQLAVFEAATGVHTFVDSPGEAPDYIPTPISLTRTNTDINANGEETERLLQDEDLKTVRQGFWNRFLIWTKPAYDRANDVSRKVQKQAENLLLKQSKKKNQTIATIEFRKGAKLNVNAKIAGEEIDDVQAAMIRNMEFTGKIGNGESLTTAAQTEIVREVRRIHKARMNAYAAWGYEITSPEQFNMTIDVGNPITGALETFYRNPADAPRIVTDNFSLPHSEVYVGGGRVRIEEQIDRLQFGIMQNLIETVEQKRPEITLKAIEGHIQRLESQSKPQNADRVAEIDTELTKLNEVAEYFTTVEKLENEKQDLINNERVIEQRLNDPSGLVDSAGSPITYNDILSEYTRAQNEIATAQNDITAYQGLIERRKTSVADLRAREESYQRELSNIASQMAGRVSAQVMSSLTAREGYLLLQLNGNPTGTPPTTGLVDAIRVQESQRDRAITDLASAETTLFSKKSAYEALKTHLPESKYNTAKQWVQDRDGIRTQISQKEIEITDNKRRNATKIQKDPVNIAAGTWTDNELKKRIEDLKTEKENANSKDPVIERKLTAYRELQDRLKPENLKVLYDRARRPADHPQSREYLTQAVQTYPEYPQSYLYALQIIYGNDITLPQNYENLKRATQWFTPELFTRMLPSSPSVFSGRLNTTAACLDVNAKYIKQVISSVMDDANRGTLGEYSQVDKSDLKVIEREKSGDYDALKKDRSETVTNTNYELNSKIPNYEVRAILARDPSITVGLIGDYCDTFEQIYLNPSVLPENPSFNEVLNYFKTQNPSVRDVEAENVVNKLYGLYNRGAVVKETYQRVLETLDGRYDVREQAERLSAAAGLILNAHEQDEFLTLIRSGQSFEDIYLTLRTSRPEYFNLYQQMRNDIIIGTDFYTSVRNVYRNQVEDIVGAGNMRNPEIIDQLALEQMLIDAIHDEVIVDYDIKKAEIVYPSIGVADMALRILKASGGNASNVDDVRYAKMIAEKIFQKRESAHKP